MLEAAVLLEIVLGKYFEAATIAFLLAFNAGLGFFQEGRAQPTLLALKSRLALTASVKRDNAWKTVSAIDLVVGDVVKLSLRAVVPADARLTDGSILLDQSMLTGESVPIEAATGFEAFAGALVRRGETVAELTATGAATKFGSAAKFRADGQGGEYPTKGGFRVSAIWLFSMRALLFYLSSMRTS
jgi:H+-transporting ATPase